MGYNLLAGAIHSAAGRPPMNCGVDRVAGVASLSVTAPETAEEFSERIVATIDSASLALLLSIGHQTGLLDTMAGLAAATSAQIAEAAGLNERYVREWLGGMTTGHVVDYDAENGTYSLPAHRAGVLTRAAGPNNLALVAQFIPLLSEVEQKVIGCFRAGGGAALQRISALPHVDGRDEWCGVRRRARRCRAAVGRRPRRTPALRRGRRRFRLRQRSCDQRDGAGVSGEPIHRRRLFRRKPSRPELKRRLGSV